MYTMRYFIPYLPHGFLSVIADLIGTLLKRGRHARIIKKELRKLLGEEKSDSELDRIVVESIRNYRKDLFEIWSFPRLNKKKIAKFVYVEGKENLDKALEKGRGVIIGVSHFGSWKINIKTSGY